VIDTAEMDWITAVRTDVIDDETEQDMGGEFFCHSMLQIARGPRLTVSATGAQENRFPTGFGIHTGVILDALPDRLSRLELLGMVLNNYEPEIDRHARVRATIEYLTEEDLDFQPLRRLYSLHVVMEVQDLRQYQPPEGTNPDDPATHCNLVSEANDHWYVPPGPQKTVRRFDRMSLPGPATVHYISTHMHNHGEWVRLTDLTTGERLWQADVTHHPDRRQIVDISVYSSAEGFRVYPDHAYELEAFYDNTTDHDVDAMAAMYMYFNPEGNKELYVKGSADW
jgi:hypothetical protein